MSNYNVSPIIKNAPIPQKIRAPRATKNPITARMQNLGVGQSFVVEGAELKSIHPQLFATSKRLGIKISTRTVDNGVQVWRIQNRQSAQKSTGKQRKAA